MARDASGNYSLPAGNPVVSGTIIESVWANTTLNDLSFAMTESLSRQGEGGMLAALGLISGTQGAPSIYFGAGIQNGLYSDASDNFISVIANDNKMRWSTVGSEIWNGTAWDLIRGESDHHFDGPNPSISNTDAALTVGGSDPDTQQHLELGPTAIQAKLDETTVTSLSINTFGGGVVIGDNLSAGEPSLQLFNGDTMLVGGETIVIGESPSDPQITIESTGIEIGVNGGDVFIGDSTIVGEPSIMLSPAGNAVTIGATTITLQEDSSSSGISIGSGSVLINNSVGDNVLQTTTTGAGGVLVNNLDTGAGFERVLTTSDVDDYKRVRVIENSGATVFTLTVANSWTYFRLTDDDPITFSVQTNLVQPIAVGTEYDFKKLGTGSVEFVPSVGVTINTPSVTFGLNNRSMGPQFSSAKMIYTGFDQWDLVLYD